MKSHALVHGLGQTWLQISRNPTGATGSIAPHMGAIAALELSAQKSASDVLPAFVALNSGTAIVGSGYLPSLYSPFSVQVATQPGQGLPSLTHPDGSAAFTRRWSDLQSIDATLRNGAPLGKEDSDLVDFDFVDNSRGYKTNWREEAQAVADQIVASLELRKLE